MEKLRISVENFESLEKGKILPFPDRTFSTYQSCVICRACGQILAIDLDENDEAIPETLISVGWKKSVLSGKWYCGKCAKNWKSAFE